MISKSKPRANNIKAMTDDEAAYRIRLTPKILKKFRYDLMALMLYAESRVKPN